MSPRRTALPLALAALLLALAGCHAVLEPSLQERRSSFSRASNAYLADTLQPLLETYYVIATAPGARGPVLDAHAGRVSVPDAAHRAYSEGLAVGVDRAGYLLTARHIIRGSVYVVGWMDGRLALRPARVVAMGRPSDPDEDSAVIAVDAPLDYCAHFGAFPAKGDAVFAVICNHPAGGIGGELGMAAGTVLEAAGPGGRGPSLIATDVPLWYGDSGGPLLSASGNLVGVNSAIRFAWSEGGRFLGDYVRFSCLADGPFVRTVISADRARRGR
jgi:S1-C subfamily serine protease